MINRTAGALEKWNCAVCRQRTSRLYRRLTEAYDREGLIEIDSLYELCSLVTDVGDFKEYVRGQFSLVSKVPLLNIGVSKMGIDRRRIVSLSRQTRRTVWIR